MASRVVRGSPALIAFAIAALAALVVALIQGPKPFYYDSGGYWSLADTFVRNGHFSFFDYEYTGFRGYFLPLLYWTTKNVGELVTSNESLIVRGMNSAVFALIGTVLAPRLAAIAWPTFSWGVGRRLALATFILVFWSGFLSFPLSDFPALAAALLALVAISRQDSPGWLLVAGLAAGAALNMRPAYVLLMPLLVGLLVWSWTEGRGAARPATGRMVLCAAALLIGFATVSVPQSAFQHREFGEFSPIPGSSNLVRLQYRAGLEFQRYDVYVSGPPRMEYVDPHTEEIVDGLEGGTVSGPIGYLEIIARHPLTMAGVFLRHVVNGLDQRYTTPYIETLESEQSGFDSAWHGLLRVSGFLLVFLALLRVIWPAGRRSLGPARWRYPLALLIVGASSIPSAVETRFLLPTFLLSAMLVVAPGWPQALEEIRTDPRRDRDLALACCAGASYALVVWTIVSAATDQLRLS